MTVETSYVWSHGQRDEEQPAESPLSRESAAHCWQAGQAQGARCGFEHMNSGRALPLSSCIAADLHSVQAAPLREGLAAERKDKRECVRSRLGRQSHGDIHAVLVSSLSAQPKLQSSGKRIHN